MDPNSFQFTAHIEKKSFFPEDVSNGIGGCPHMTWGRTLEKALQRNSLPTEFAKWHELAADRGQWRAICGANKAPGQDYGMEMATSEKFT